MNNNEVTLFDDKSGRVMLSNGQFETDAQLFCRLYGVNEQPKYLYDRDAAFKGDAPHVADAVKALGAPVVRSWLQAQIFDLAVFCGTQQHVTERQTAQIADLMLSSFNLRASEYVLFFALVKSGELDITTSYLDGRVLMKALKKFSNDYKGAAFAQLEREQAREERRNTPTRAQGLLNLRDYNRQARREGHRVCDPLRIPDELLELSDDEFLEAYDPREIANRAEGVFKRV